jgi:hypothetical protein
VKAKTAVGRARAEERSLHCEKVLDSEAAVQEEPAPLGRVAGSERSMATAGELHCVHEGEQSVVSEEEGLELWQVFVNKEWSLRGRATWSDFAIAYTPPEQGDSAFHAVQRATTRHGFGKDPNGRREEAFSNKRLLAATDLRLRATECIGNAHSKGNLVMGELVSNDRREVKVWDHLSAWGYRVERDLTYDDNLGWMSQNGTYATRASFMALAAEAERPVVLLRVHRLQTVTSREEITDVGLYNPKGMGGADGRLTYMVGDGRERALLHVESTQGVAKATASNQQSRARARRGGHGP